MHLTLRQQSAEADGCHTDGHPFQLGVVGLLDDCPADGGAFKVWPGSHTRLFPRSPCVTTSQEFPIIRTCPRSRALPTVEAYTAELKRVIEEIEPVECFGQAGDIVFWHHRLAHAAGQNYSEQIRQAVLADFWTLDLDALRTKPVTADMWEDWSPALQRLGEQ